MARVFISYGHDLFETIVTELAVYLAENGEHIAFKDNVTKKTIVKYKSQKGAETKIIKGSVAGIPVGGYYDLELDYAIQNCDFFISVLSRYSIRPDGVCLDEIARAREFSKKILPMRVEKVAAPFLICRIQWIELIIDVHDGEIVHPDDWEVKRNEVFGQILEIINKGDPMPTTGRPILEKKLIGEPFDFSAILIEKSRHFVGRREMLREIGEWVEERGDGFAKVLMIFGDPGSGKTALCARMPYITHICCYDKEASIDVYKIIGNLAFQLSVILSDEFSDEYVRLLLNDEKIDNINNLSLSSLIEFLFVTVLNRVTSPENPVPVVIDGIDEIKDENREIFLNAVFNCRERLPSWLRIIMTGRRGSRITPYFNRRNSTIINLDMGDLNKKDCKEYLRTRLKGLDIHFTEPEICEIVNDRNANFLFLYYLIEDLRLTGTKVLNKDVIPSSIGEFYLRSFNRFFADKRDYYNNKVRPVLELLCVAKTEMNVRDIAVILNSSVQSINDIVSSTGSIVVRSSNDIVFFYHRTIRDWLTNHIASGDYSIEITDGEKRIIGYISNFYDEYNSLPDSDENSYIYRFGTVHIIENRRTVLFEKLFRSFDSVTLNEMFYSFNFVSASHTAAFLKRLKQRMRNQLLFSLCFEFIIDSYTDNNMFQSAIEICDELIVCSEDAFKTELFCAYSIANGKLGRTNEAAQFAEKALRSAKMHFSEQSVYAQLCVAKAYQVAGVALQKSGDSDNAKIEFEKAEKKLIDILNSADKIDWPEKSVLMIHVYNWLIYIYGALGTINFDEYVDLANGYFEKELDSVNKLADLMNTHRVQYKRTVAFNHLAECELVYVKYEEAEEHANESVERTEKLYLECPTLRIRRGLAISYGFRASARKKLGRISEYVSDAQRGLEHITGIFEEYPGERAKRDLALSKKRMGEAKAADAEFAEAGRSEALQKESVKYFEEAIEILKDLTGASKNEGDIQSVLFGSENSFRNWFILSDTYLILGLTFAKRKVYKTEAFDHLEKARRILEILDREKPSVVFRKNLAVIFLYEGWIYLDKGDGTKGISCFEKAKNLGLYADDGEKTVDYYSLMFRSFFAMGEAYHRCGQESISDQHYMDAVDLLDQYFENRLTDNDRKELLSLIKKQEVSEPEQTRGELERILSGMKDDYSPLILNKIIDFIIMTIY